MPYQRDFEEHLKKKEELPIGWPWRLLISILIIFIVLIFIYAGMVFGYRPYLNSQIKKYNNDILNLGQSVDESRQEKLIGIYSQIVNIRSLLDKHKMLSGIFNFLERNTYPFVRYNILSFDADSLSVKIDASTSDYDALIKELALLNSAPEVESLILKNSGVSEIVKGILETRFEISVNLKPEAFEFYSGENGENQ